MLRAFELYFLCCFACLIIYSLACSQSVQAQSSPSQQINFQAKIDGIDSETVSLTITMFNSPDGREEVWRETHESVVVTEGIAQILLGSVTSFPDSAFIAGATRYLKLTVNGVEFEDRFVLSSVPFAIQSEWAEGSQAEFTVGRPGQGRLVVQGSDITLGINGLHDVMNKPAQRALVHTPGDSLHLNFQGDFEGGVKIEGPLEVQARGSGWFDHLTLRGNADPLGWRLLTDSGDSNTPPDRVNTLRFQYGNVGGSGILNLLTDGRIGVGTLAPVSPFHVQARGTGWFDHMHLQGSSGNAGWNILVDSGLSGSAESLRFIYSNFSTESESINFKVNGFVGIGVANPTYKLDVNGEVRASNYATRSDRRYKTEIKEIQSPLDRIQQLRGISHNWNNEKYPDKDFAEGRTFGFIAQEVNEVFPELVDIDDDGYYSVTYSKLTPILVEALKEQQVIIHRQQEALEKHNKELQMMRSELEAIKELLRSSSSIPVQTTRQNF